jgi:hypothetical protein
MKLELREFPFTPLRFEDGLPAFEGREARKELVRRFGLPNAAPMIGEKIFSCTRCMFVDDDQDGKPIAYWIRRQSSVQEKPSQDQSSQAS